MGLRWMFLTARALLLVEVGCAQAMGEREAHNPSPGPFPKGRGGASRESLSFDT
jgi:hypothetical protein